MGLCLQLTGFRLGKALQATPTLLMVRALGWRVLDGIPVLGQ